MGEIAEMMLEGVLCQCCGVYMGGEGDGFPVTCRACGGLAPAIAGPKVKVRTEAQKARQRRKRARRKERERARKAAAQAQPVANG